MTTEAQKRATARYCKKLKSVTVRFSPDSPEWRELKKHKEKSKYIRRLIREDAARNGD